MATQACPCGHFTDPGRECRCPEFRIQRYLSRVSGPLLDRIYLHVEVPAVRHKELSSRESGESSERIRGCVVKARDRQARGFQGRCGLYANAGMQSREIREFCLVYPAVSGSFIPAPVRVILHHVIPGIDFRVDFHNPPPKPWR